MKAVWFGLFSLVVAVPLGAQNIPPASPVVETVKVNIEANEQDKRWLVERLNRHGLDHRLRFEPVEQGYDYRIVFSTRQEKNLWATVGSVNVSGATTTVYDGKDTELFHFNRSGRATDTGAANAVAKEIIKRLIRLRHGEPAQTSNP